MDSDVKWLVLLSAAALLPGCASSPPPPSTISSTQGTFLVQTAQVTNVKDVVLRDGRSTGLGSFVGSILGGVAGSKIGSGTGSAVAGIGGAVAGGMAGQHAEQSGSGRSTTEVTVRLDNGELRTFAVEPGESFRVGEMVKVTTNNGLVRLSH
ncbi:glycine zipper 2TM domain-containing protein [Noviherbaspirillum saxi]|uniref:Glycine zipper 2TM domain-containing protein n=1 Tax=Noviherbaspirillum saxi TaxID=2320863 RepID=A0A3A3FP25_9BURK|nr:glycine zipper 2TM domain-containing protein [Noviherbaspirillum saxi]RJF97766.1 glycine zipper 2TM domain-containing protein [Noviherbaspirillum saxi]